MTELARDAIYRDQNLSDVSPPFSGPESSVVPGPRPAEDGVRVTRPRPSASESCGWCWPLARQYPTCGLTEAAAARTLGAQPR